MTDWHTDQQSFIETNCIAATGHDAVVTRQCYHTSCSRTVTLAHMHLTINSCLLKHVHSILSSTVAIHSLVFIIKYNSQMNTDGDALLYWHSLYIYLQSISMAVLDQCKRVISYSILVTLLSSAIFVSKHSKVKAGISEWRFWDGSFYKRTKTEGLGDDPRHFWNLALKSVNFHALLTSCQWQSHGKDTAVWTATYHYSLLQVLWQQRIWNDCLQLAQNTLKCTFHRYQC